MRGFKRLLREMIAYAREDEQRGIREGDEFTRGYGLGKLLALKMVREELAQIERRQEEG